MTHEILYPRIQSTTVMMLNYVQQFQQFPLAGHAPTVLTHIHIFEDHASHMWFGLRNRQTILSLQCPRKPCPEKQDYSSTTSEWGMLTSLRMFGPWCCSTMATEVADIDCCNCCMWFWPVKYGTAEISCRQAEKFQTCWLERLQRFLPQFLLNCILHRHCHVNKIVSKCSSFQGMFSPRNVFEACLISNVIATSIKEKTALTVMLPALNAICTLKLASFSRKQGRKQTCTGPPSVVFSTQIFTLGAIPKKWWCYQTNIWKLLILAMYWVHLEGCESLPS